MAVQTISVTRLRGTRNPARSDARPSGSVSAARSAATTMGPASPQRSNPRWLSDVDAWALPFDLACGGTGVPTPRGPRGDTYEVWS